MKSSVFVAATSAVLAMATPVEKRKMETSVVWQYTTVTVIGNTAPEPTVFSPANVPKPAPEPAPVPEPETTDVPVVIVTVTPEPPAPAPVYPTEVPVEAPPAPEPTTVVEPAKPTEPVEAPPAAPVEPAGDDMPSAAIYHHNLHRSNHSAPEVTWDSKIAGYAANTARTCKFAHDMTQGDGGYGQNLAMWAVSDGAAELGAAGAIKMATTNMWYDGEFNSYLPSYYGQATPDMGNFEAWGHYSQLLWKDSNRLGCEAFLCVKGTMFDDMDAWYMVCNYGPPGNVGGAYGDNVLQPLGKATVVA